MGEEPADGKFGFHLFDEPNVLVVDAHHMLERERLARQGIHDRVNRATRTFSQTLQNIKVEEFLNHVRLPPVWMSQHLLAFRWISRASSSSAVDEVMDNAAALTVG